MSWDIWKFGLIFIKLGVKVFILTFRYRAAIKVLFLCILYVVVLCTYWFLCQRYIICLSIYQGCNVGKNPQLDNYWSYFVVIYFSVLTAYVHVMLGKRLIHFIWTTDSTGQRCSCLSISVHKKSKRYTNWSMPVMIIYNRL